MKILLLNLPQNIYDVSDYASLLPPYGLALLSSCLKQAGYDVTLLDAFAHQIRLGELVKYVLKVKPKVLGISIMTPGLAQTTQFLSFIKKELPETITITGGVHPTVEYESMLRNHKAIDIAVIGEGEETIVELAERISHGEPIDSVAGIAYRSNGEIKANINRALVQDLDSLPFGDWGSLPMSRYWDRWMIKKNYCLMLLSRGCPYYCTFCGHSIIGKKYRKRSPAMIMEEIKLLYDKYGVRNISFGDSTVNIDNAWLREICDRLLGLKRKILWGCSLRADRVDRQDLKLMKKSGCVKVFIGVESADERMLKKMKKAESFSHIEEGIRVIQEAGLTPDMGFIIGMPGETRESIMKTINFTRRFNKSVCSFTYATPYPGTEFYNTAKNEGFTVSDWSKFNTFSLAYVPHGFNEDEIRHYFKLAVKSTYLRIPFLIAQLLNVRSWTNFWVNACFAYRLFFKVISRKNNKIN